jgi:hypothetical protein
VSTADDPPFEFQPIRRLLTAPTLPMAVFVMK